MTMHEVYNEVPEDKKCPYCFSPLRLEYATYTPTLELWLYKCSGFCENRYMRLSIVEDTISFKK